MGFAEAKKDSFAIVDNAIGKEEIAGLTIKPKLIGLLPEYDSSSKTFKAPSEDSFKEICSIVEIKCEGNYISPSTSASLKVSKRLKFPPIIDIECSTNLHSKEPAIVD